MKKVELQEILSLIEAAEWNQVVKTLTTASLGADDEPQILSIFYTMVEKRVLVATLRSMMRKFGYIQLDSKSMSLQKLIEGSEPSPETKTMLACAYEGSRCKRIIHFLLVDKHKSNRLGKPFERLDYSKLDLGTLKLIVEHLDWKGLQFVALAVSTDVKHDDAHYWTRLHLVKDAINSYFRMELGSILHAFVALLSKDTGSSDPQVAKKVVITIQQIIDKFPELVRTKDNDGNLPLHVCVAKGNDCVYNSVDTNVSSCNIIKVLLEAYPEGSLKRNNDGYLAIHIAAKMGSINCLSTFIERAPECENVPCDKKGLRSFQLLPIREFNYSGINLDAFDIILKHLDKWRAFKRPPFWSTLRHVALAVSTDDEHYWTKMDLVKDSINSHYGMDQGSPLHAFVAFFAGYSHFVYDEEMSKGKVMAVIQQLMDKYPELVRTKNNYGNLPLQVCVGEGDSDLCSSWDTWGDILKALLKAYPEGAMERNNAGRLAIHIAAEKGLIKSIFTLVEEAPGCLDVACGKTGLFSFQLLATCTRIWDEDHVSGIFQLLSKSPMLVESATRCYSSDDLVVKEMAFNDKQIARLEREHTEELTRLERNYKQELSLLERKHKLETVPFFAKRQRLQAEFESQKNHQPKVGDDNDAQGNE